MIRNRTMIGGGIVGALAQGGQGTIRIKIVMVVGISAVVFGISESVSVRAIGRNVLNGLVLDGA